MPLQATSGAASYDAFGGGVVAEPNYIESVFSTYLYTGTQTSLPIVNGIDLAGKGGLVWGKDRTFSGENHWLIDTVRGGSSSLNSNLTDRRSTNLEITSFNSDGFTLSNNSNINYGPTNPSPHSYVSWTFREQPKFFDVVTWTGTGSNTTIAHSLGSVPGCIIVKRIDATAAWAVYHRSLANTEYLVLNTTAAVATGATWWNSTTPTSAVFSVGTDATVNASGGTYVAYLFAHDAGGFGLTGTDNVISCGSFTTDGSGNASVTLGYEPQWLLTKSSSGTSSWMLSDNMRGWVSGAGDYPLYANLTNAEGASTSQTIGDPTATGFTNVLNPSATYIYIAIRRGPMKVPTVGTSVYNASFKDGATLPTYKGGFVVDLGIQMSRDGDNHMFVDRMRGAKRVFANLTNAEDSETDAKFDYMNGFFANTGTTTTKLGYMFRRAPSVFDVVCYTGTGATNAVNHNLAAPAEMIIVKGRNYTVGWTVGANLQATHITLGLNTNSAQNNPASNQFYFGNGTVTVNPTSTQFTVRTADINQNGNTYVAYLFATCAGVSKVFSYTGNGGSQTINCGFTSGARFVMIKRTDSTGDWYVWDSARGIVSGNDPHLSLNTTASEVTTDDSVDTDSTGFVVNQLSATDINVSSATYIGLAIA
jgi:hypothetical protein